MKPTLLLFLLQFLAISLSAQVENKAKKETKSTVDKKSVKEKDKPKKKVEKTKEKKAKSEEKKSKKSKSNSEKLTLPEKKKEKSIVKQNAPLYKPIRKNGKMITGSIYTSPGFRICIYSGSNREEAIQIKQNFIRSGSQYKNYITYSRPYYKIKVGDFETKKVFTFK